MRKFIFHMLTRDVQVFELLYTDGEFFLVQDFMRSKAPVVYSKHNYEGTFTDTLNPTQQLNLREQLKSIDKRIEKLVLFKEILINNKAD